METSGGGTNGTPHLYETPLERREITGIVLGDGISVGGLIEVEASAGREGGVDVSDVVLATFELGIEAEVSELVRGRAVLLWEEGDEEQVDLDEAVITVGGDERLPGYLKAGRMYVPFGNFSSHFVSDPITLELAETRETALLAGFGNDLLDVSAGVFAGSADEDDNRVNDVVAALTLNMGRVLQVGGYWISNMGESDSLEELVHGNVAGGSVALQHDKAAGAGGFAGIRIGRFVADAEYVTALEDFAAGTLDEAPLRPAAWNIEAGVRFDANEAEIAFKYEGSDDFPGFPGRQYGIGSSLKICESVALAMEYLHGEFDDDTEDRDVVTGQIAMEF